MDFLNSPQTVGIAWVLVIVVIAYRMHKYGGFKALAERSRNSPQYWGEFALIIAGVFLFVYFLIII